MRWSYSLLILLCLFNTQVLLGQQETLDDTHLFQTFFQDAAVSESPYGEAILGFSDIDRLQVINLGVRGSIPINSQFEIGGSLAFLSSDQDFGNGESGISDVRVTGRYHFQTRQATKITAGAFITLPIGDEDLGQSELNLGVFGALRHPIAARTVITGTLSLEFLEGAPVRNGGWPRITVFGRDRETALLLGGGVIHQATEQFNVIGELNLVTEGDFALLSGGIDYKLQSSRLRGTLGLGLDNGAPDLAIVVGFLHFFN